MAQVPKIVDLTKGFVFTDPESFVDNRGHTQQQDTPTETLPVVAMAGYNFLPTPYGYRSYFGDSSILDIAGLTSRCDHLLLFQKADYSNVLVALCEDGIHISSPSVSGSAWTHSVVYAVPPVGTHYEWTYALLENVLYCYRQNQVEVWKFSYLTGAFSKEVPCTVHNYATLVEMTAAVYTSSEVGKLVYCYENSSYYYISSTTTEVLYSATTHGNFILNMSGQMGIFRANLRLAFWDSANSIGWSDLYNKMDFEPSVITRAGNTVFSGILGRIVQVLPQGSGFVIYSTKNIIGVRFTNEIASIWDAMNISDVAGIAYPRQVCTGANDSDHYAYTNVGFMAIGKYNPVSGRNDSQIVMPEIYDILKESNEPVYLDFIAGRFLFINLISVGYITGDVGLSYITGEDLQVRVLFNSAQWDGISILPVTIGPQTVSASLAQALQSGNTEGMYIRWTAQGTTADVGRTTPLSPYVTDIEDVHIPNSPLDTTSLLSSVDVQTIVNGGALTHGSPSWLGTSEILGWEVGTIAASGVHLPEFFATQTAEWDNIEAIQTATLAALVAHTPVVGDWVVYSGPHATEDVPASSYEDTLLGHVMSCSGVDVATEVFPSTRANVKYLTRAMSGGTAVSRREALDYRSVAGTPVYAYAAGPLVDTFFYGYTIGGAGISVNIPLAVFWTEATRAADLAAFALSLNPSVATIHPFYGTLSNPHVTYSTYNRADVKYSSTNPSYDNGIGYSVISYGDYHTPYFVEKQLTKSLVFEASTDPSLEYEAEASAVQDVLDWGYVTNYPGIYQYTDGAITVSGIDLDTYAGLPRYAEVTYPGASFLLQDGSIAPIYPTFAGALVLDTHLKKLGKYKGNYQNIVEFAPINNNQPSIPYTNFGMSAGMINAAGEVRGFTAQPVDSYIRYGKYGLYRLGMTVVHEVIVMNRSPMDFQVTVESSLDGRSIPNYTSSYTENPGSIISVNYPDQSGRWHTIKISGNYDLTGLEIRGTISGRR